MSHPRGEPLRVARDCWVVLDYALYIVGQEDEEAEDEVIEATDEEGNDPVRYVHGYGALVPGLERGLLGMAPGETRVIEVPPEGGYGPADPDLEAWVDRADFPTDIEVDDEFAAEGPEGEETTVRVVEIGEDAVLIDRNHPLAGKTLRFDVIVREVRPASDAEIAAARAEAPRTSLRVVSPGSWPKSRPNSWEGSGPAPTTLPSKEDVRRKPPSSPSREDGTAKATPSKPLWDEDEQ